MELDLRLARNKMVKPVLRVVLSKVAGQGPRATLVRKEVELDLRTACKVVEQDLRQVLALKVAELDHRPARTLRVAELDLRMARNKVAGMKPRMVRTLKVVLMVQAIRVAELDHRTALNKVVVMGPRQ